jgi:hypothetical protein
MKKPISFLSLLVLLSVASNPTQSAHAEGLAVKAEATARYICTWAPSQSKVVPYLVGLAGGGAAGTKALLTAVGLTAVEHSSKALIFTGSGGYVAGTLGGAQVGPVLVVAGVVVAGVTVSLELLCAPINHPEFVAKVEASARDFYIRSLEVGAEIPQKPGEAWQATKKVAAAYKADSVKWGADAIDYAKRKSVTVSDAMRSIAH